MPGLPTISEEASESAKGCRIMSVKSYIGHRVREAGVHWNRWLQPGARPRVAILPCSTRALGSSNLRAYAISEHLRTRGWRTSLIPSQLERSQRIRVIEAERPDVLLIQMHRHADNRPRLYPSIPSVFDIDGADYLDPNSHDAVVECCRDSAGVIAGSATVADWCKQYNPNVTVVWTGTPAPKISTRIPPEARRPILSWAHSDPMSYPGECRLVRELLLRLAEGTDRFEFRLYGLQETRESQQYLEPIREAGVPVQTFSYMDYQAFLATLGEVAVGLHPVDAQSPYSRGKSFGKVLAYLAMDVAVVTSNANDHPLFFRDGINGALAEGLDSWVESTRRLLFDPEHRRQVVEAARKDFERDLTIDAAAKKVDAVLRNVLSRTQAVQPKNG